MVKYSTGGSWVRATTVGIVPTHTVFQLGPESEIAKQRHDTARERSHLYWYIGRVEDEA